MVSDDIPKIFYDLQINFGLITILSGHLGPVVGLVSHPKYPMLISASSDCSIRIWCLETFTLTQRIDTEHVIQTIKLSSDYNYFYYCSKKEVGQMFSNVPFELTLSLSQTSYFSLDCCVIHDE